MIAQRPNAWANLFAGELAQTDKAPLADPLIVIGVCTRGRRALLRRLVESIWAQPVPVRHAVELVVVDNNDHPEAATALEGLPDHFPIMVVHEARAGLVHARNRALDVAAARGAAWFIGVDDDEWVAPDWLAQFIAGIETLGQPILIAPCHYVYDDDLSDFVYPAQWPQKARGERPVVLASSNFAMHCSVFDKVRGFGMRFDPAFNESGGEDLEFFLRAERLHGWTVAAWPDAVAFENWGGTRATLGYRLRRKLRNQVSAYQVARQHRRAGIYGSRIGNLFRLLRRVNRHFVYGIGKLAIGLVLWPVRPKRARYLIGEGLERGACAVAALPFIIGRIPIAYGPRARPD